MDECIRHRRTGRSTGIALKYISDSYNNPGKKYKVKDHYPTHAAAKIVFNNIRDMICRLKLNGYVFTPHTLEIEYEGCCNALMVKCYEKEFGLCTCSNCGKIILK